MALLAGTFPAIVTPFTPGGRDVELDWMGGHLAYLRRRGADGVLALGTNGEGPSLSLSERKQVIDAVIRQRPDPGLAVMVGSGCAAAPETVELSNYALERGADALLIVPPFYFKSISDEGLLAYYQSVLAALPAGARVYLYNIPKFSGVPITHPVLDGLLQSFPDRLAGLKDTSGELSTLEGYLQRYPSLSVFSGSDGLAAEGYRLGAVGCISGVANVFPDLMGAPAKARSEQEREAAQAAIDRVRGLTHGYPTPSVLKHLLRIVASLPQTYVRPPLRDLTPQEASELERKTRELGLE
jgi:4-hydroxy-tetrahydrodipicolinate synthase